MQHAVKSSPMDDVEEYFWGKIALRVRGALFLYTFGLKYDVTIVLLDPNF